MSVQSSSTFPYVRDIGLAVKIISREVQVWITNIGGGGMPIDRYNRNIKKQPIAIHQHTPMVIGLKENIEKVKYFLEHLLIPLPRKPLKFITLLPQV